MLFEFLTAAGAVANLLGIYLVFRKVKELGYQSSINDIKRETLSYLLKVRNEHVAQANAAGDEPIADYLLEKSIELEDLYKKIHAEGILNLRYEEVEAMTDLSFLRMRRSAVRLLGKSLPNSKIGSDFDKMIFLFEVRQILNAKTNSKSETFANAFKTLYYKTLARTLSKTDSKEPGLDSPATPDNLRRDLIAEYQRALIVEDDPKRRARIEHELARLKALG